MEGQVDDVGRVPFQASERPQVGLFDAQVCERVRSSVPTVTLLSVKNLLLSGGFRRS